MTTMSNLMPRLMKELEVKRKEYKNELLKADTGAEERNRTPYKSSQSDDDSRI